MPKKIGSNTPKILLVVVIIAVIGVAFIAWHDGKIDATPMGSINDFTVDSGTAVTVRGTITLIVGPMVTITDDTGGVAFAWSDTASLTLHSIVVVKGEVFSPHILTDVTSVERVWLFA